MKKTPVWENFSVGDTIKMTNDRFHEVLAVIIRNGSKTVYVLSAGWFKDDWKSNICRSVEPKPWQKEYSVRKCVDSYPLMTAYQLSGSKRITYIKQKNKIVTMDQIAEKFGVSVKKLKIKK